VKLTLSPAHAPLALSSALPLLVGLLLAPLLTAAVSASAYGEYVNYLLVCSIANVFIGASTAGYIANAFTDSSATGEILGSMNAVLFSTALLVLAALALWGASQDAPDALLVVAVVASGLSSYAIAMTQAFATIQTRYDHLLRTALVLATAQIALSVALVIVWKLGVLGLVLSHVGSLAICAVYCRGVTNRALNLSPAAATRARAAAVVKYGLPLMPHLVLSLGAGTFDRWLMAGVGRLDELAVYSIAVSVAAPVTVLLDVANKIYSPAVFRRLRDGVPAEGDVWRGVCSMAVAGVVAATFVACAGYAFIALTFDERYQDAAVLCVPLAYAWATFAVYYSAAPYLYFRNSTGKILVATASGAAVTVVASLHLDAIFGVYGLIAAKALGFMITGIVALGLVRHMLRPLSMTSARDIH
jgi:O-antigen/teichoic acid export membrane protein